MINTSSLFTKLWGAELLRLRLKKELPQKKVAAIVGISVRGLYDLEHGRVHGSMFMYECIVKALGESFLDVRNRVMALFDVELAKIGKKF